MAEGLSRPKPTDADPFHANVRAALEAFPYRIGPWEGQAVPVPESAQALLRPNALLSREFVDRAGRRSATLIVVQTRDSRDMQGHYPPNCYPSQGWTSLNAGEESSVQLAGETMPVIRYEFQRTGFDRQRRLVIYSFFVLPGKGYALDMNAVSQAAADYRARGFGAAQVQIVMDDSWSKSEEVAVCEELLEPLAPVIGTLKAGAGGA